MNEITNWLIYGDGVLDAALSPLDVQDALFDAFRLLDRSPWAVARLLLWMREHVFQDDDAWSGYLEDVGTQYHKSIGTLRNWITTAKAFPPGEEFEGLSFTHHTEVAHLEGQEREFWMHAAFGGQWSVEKLRAALAGPRDTFQVEPTKIGSWFGSAGLTVKTTQREVTFTRGSEKVTLSSDSELRWSI